MILLCYNIQDKVGAVTTRKPARGENPPTKKPPSKTHIQQESPHRERATLEHTHKEIKETTPLSTTELLPQKSTPQRQAGKTKHPEMQK